MWKPYLDIMSGLWTYYIPDMIYPCVGLRILFPSTNFASVLLFAFERKDCTSINQFARYYIFCLTLCCNELRVQPFRLGIGRMRHFGSSRRSDCMSRWNCQRRHRRMRCCAEWVHLILFLNSEGGEGGSAHQDVSADNTEAWQM